MIIKTIYIAGTHTHKYRPTTIIIIIIITTSSSIGIYLLGIKHLFVTLSECAPLIKTASCIPNIHYRYIIKYHLSTHVRGAYQIPGAPPPPPSRGFCFCGPLGYLRARAYTHNIVPIYRWNYNIIVYARIPAQCGTLYAMTIGHHTT